MQHVIYSDMQKSKQKPDNLTSNAELEGPGASLESFSALGAASKAEAFSLACK